ncbi:MAG: pilus (MSHA type) biogenesis protein MshL [Pseudomonadota bacterium]
MTIRHETRTPYLTSLSALALLALAGCAQVKEKPALAGIQEEVRKAAEARPAAPPLPPAVAAALAPATKVEAPRPAAPAEPRFDLAVNNAPAQQVFLGIASGTRYSMLLHPEVAGSLTLNLKEVTVPEAMEAIRDLYGYDYKVDGNRITVQPLTPQTRFYSLSYPSAIRQGRSELRVISGAVTDNKTTSGNSGSTTSQSSEQIETSRLSTESRSDFWSELQASIGLLVGCSAGTPPACPAGRSVMVSPHTGMLAVRALPAEQRQVAEYLKAARLTVERQVMIEAKILEVTLNEGAQSGINWAYFSNKGNNVSKGIDSTLLPTPMATTPPTSTVGDLLGGGLTTASGATAAAAGNAGLFGLALQTSNFLALLNFLETQGTVQVLSSPRIAAINNQKAVLKVGTDEFFVTNVTTTTTTGTTSTTSPSVTLQPFFSGISLDVTPQIDEQGYIMLHVHPAVSLVTSSDRVVNLGTAGTLTLPLASSTISETDSIVRLRDGEIAAIGGLMKRESRDGDSGVPGLSTVPGLGLLFKNSNASRSKQELVILLKPTVIRQSSDWLESARESSLRLEGFAPPPAPAP